MKRDYQNPFKKLTLFFLSNSVPFNRQSYQKTKGVWNYTPAALQVRKQVHKNFFVISLQELQKCENLENEISFLDEIKNIFHTFSRAITR